MSAYSLWVMEFAAVPNYPQSGLIYGMHNQGTRKLPYCYIVIKGQGQLAMVDVGYNHKAHGEVLANTYGVQGWHSPREVLGEIGITPEDINHIFITHAHFDHMGNIEDFPNAKFYLARARAFQMGVDHVAGAPVPLADAGHRSGGHHARGGSGAARAAGVRWTAIVKTCCPAWICTPRSTRTPGDRCT